MSYLFVLFVRLERDLYTRKDQFGVEIRERAKWDIRESMVGTETFQVKISQRLDHFVINIYTNKTKQVF